MLPVAPAIVPRPMTDATLLRGNMSETVVKRLADHAWCAEPTSPMISTAVQLPAEPTNKIGRTSTRTAKQPGLARARDTPALPHQVAGHVPADQAQYRHDGVDGHKVRPTVLDV